MECLDMQPESDLRRVGEVTRTRRTVSGDDIDRDDSPDEDDDELEDDDLDDDDDELDDDDDLDDDEEDEEFEEEDEPPVTPRCFSGRAIRIRQDSPGPSA